MIFRELTEDRGSMDITCHNFSSDWLTVDTQAQEPTKAEYKQT